MTNTFLVVTLPEFWQYCYIVVTNIFLVAILPEVWQCCQNSGSSARNLCSSSYLDGFGSIAAILPERIIPAILRETCLHTKSGIAAILPQYCQNALQSNIAAIYCQKPCILVREPLFTQHINNRCMHFIQMLFA